MRIVAVSGGFDPIHVGHVRMINEARAYGDKLVVLMNNDNWLRAKKGFVFMREHERREVLLALRCVDDVMITGHAARDPDRSVCREIAALKPAVFVNGGDRLSNNTPEVALCVRLGIELVFGAGGAKVQSSSDLVAGARRRSAAVHKSQKLA